MSFVAAIRKVPQGRLPQFREGSLGFAIAPVRAAAFRAAAFTALINCLSLAGSFYMLAIYDFVLPARSVTALAALAVAMAGLAAMCGLLEIYRGRVLSRAGAELERSLRGRVLAAVRVLPVRLPGLGSPAQPVVDLEQVRASISGAGCAALLDLPAVPLFLTAVYLQHATLGLFATGCIVLAASVAAAAQMSTARRHSAVASVWARLMRHCAILESCGAGTPAIGTGSSPEKRWHDLSEAHARLRESAADRAAICGAAIKTARVTIQTGIVGVGAWLVMRGQISPGGMVVASILLSRALAPVEAAGANWRSLAGALASFRRLEALLNALAKDGASSAGEMRQNEATGGLPVALSRPTAQARGVQLRPVSISTTRGRCSNR